MGDDLRQQLRQLGKGLQQLRLKLSRALEAANAAPAPLVPTPVVPALVVPAPRLAPALAPAAPSFLDPLLDLLDGVEQSLDGLDPHSPHAQGLRISRDKVLERLAHAGYVAAPTTGPHDPTLHQVIEVIPTAEATRHGQLCRTFRRGWITHSGGQRRVVRPAHVSVYAPSPPA